MNPPRVVLISLKVKVILSFGDTVNRFVVTTIFLIESKFVGGSVSDLIPAKSNASAVVVAVTP